MLPLPQVLVALFPHLDCRFVDGEKLLDACLDLSPAVAGMLPLAAVHQAGWRSATARQLYAAGCDSLFRRTEPRSLAEASAADHPARPAWLRWLPGAEPARRAVRIAAPLCVTPDDNGDHRAFLCDFPPVARRATDRVIHLDVSTAVLEEIVDDLGAAANWYPFCHVLGIGRQQVRGLRIDVLEIRLASPRSPDALPEGMAWREALVEAARKADSRETEEWVARLHLEYVALNVFLKQLRQAGNTLGGSDGFWCCLAAILPAWRHHMPLDTVATNGLLAAFDEVYDAAWRQTVEHDAIAPLIRYTPAVMDEVRRRLASLAD